MSNFAVKLEINNQTTLKNIVKMKATKTEQVKAFVAKQEWAKAIKIAATFKVGFTKEEKRIMEIAKEAFTGHASFYKSLGIDVEAMQVQAIAIVSNMYNK